MRLGIGCRPAVLVTSAFLLLLSVATSLAEDKVFKDAPADAKAMKNPLEGQAAAIDAGKTLYARNCLACHGKTLQGTGNVPSLIDGKLKGITQGEVFWFITKGDKDTGMPSWAFLPEEKRWQVVSYVEAVASGKSMAAAPNAAAEPDHSTSKIGGASPKAPFTDFRYERPGTTRKITMNDLPQPFATNSAQN